VTYLIADVDNRDGAASASMRSVSVFDEDGKEYEFIEADTAISDWSAIWAIDDDEYYMPDGTEISEDEAYQLWDYVDDGTVWTTWRGRRLEAWAALWFLMRTAKSMSSLRRIQQ